MDSIGTPALWIGFTSVVAALLGVDLFLATRNPHPMTKRGALAWTAVWVSLAVAFGLGIWGFAADKSGVDGAVITSRTSAMEFFAAYLVEYSLSIDNLFVFLLLFSAFKVNKDDQHRVLFWGIFGAVLLRAIFIFAGTALLQQFHFLIYLFGAFLVFTGIKLMMPGGDDEEGDISDNFVVKTAKRFMRVSDQYDGNKFFTVQNGVKMATPLFLVLVTVELSDIVFALDSIPAVFGISLDPFIVYTSNIFAIMGLRALFFLLAGALWGLRFLKPALGVVLAFVGVKMLLPLAHDAAAKAGVSLAPLPVHVSTQASLLVIGSMLGAGVVFSMLFPGKGKDANDAKKEVTSDLEQAIGVDLDGDKKIG
jgi:tellurite resistance protein TerC